MHCHLFRIAEFLANTSVEDTTKPVLTKRAVTYLATVYGRLPLRPVRPTAKCPSLCSLLTSLI